MRPPFTYYGGKIGMAQRIVQLMPPHRVYIEPFAGSLAVLFAKPPVTHEIVNDLDGAIVNFWRVLREQPEQLERSCALTPYSRTEWLACENVDDDALDQVERARRFWVRVNQSFAKRLNRTGWSVTTVRTQSPPVSVLGRLGRFHAAAARLAGVTVECCDGVDLIDRLATPDTVVYADPTYVWATRRLSSNPEGWADRTRQSDYRYELDDRAHRRLAEVLRSTPAAVILSGYPSSLYEELYRGWWRLDVPVSVHSSNSTSVRRARRTEVIWSNRPLDEGQLDLATSEAVT